jgi:hypothetical protein
VDLVIFEKELAKALDRPEEWDKSDGAQFLIHRGTGIRVYQHGGTYRKGATASPYNKLTTASGRTVNRCWDAVTKREEGARRKNAVRDRTSFLNQFYGFRR